LNFDFSSATGLPVGIYNATSFNWWLFTFNLLFSNLSFGQINYPFTKEGNNNLQAYWYNIPSDSVKNKDNDEIIFNFVSLLQIYGPVISSSFKIQAEVYSASGKNCFDRTFHIPRSKTEDDYTVDIRDGFFKIECPVKKLPENPYKIVIAIKSGFK
jgi:hypothetical protein